MKSIEPRELPYDAQIADLTRRVAETRENLKALEGELEWWRRGRDLYGPSDSHGGAVPPEGTKPTLAKAIVRVMRESDQTEWPATAIMDALGSRGWMPNGTTAEHAVRTKLAKLARGDDAVLHRVRHGVYALKAFVPAEAS